MVTNQVELVDHLRFLYGGQAAELAAQLQTRLDEFQRRHPQPPQRPLSQQDAVLITYGDMVQAAGAAPLRTLAEFLRAHLRGVLNSVHLLPFYPYSSDDGFAVIDYRAVDPALGDWEDVAAIGRDFRLMFDAVINHVSRESAWFRGFLRNEAPYRDYFVTVPPGIDLSVVFRPRALPLLTEVETAVGPKLVWTTFSADQIDLNYANPAVLLEIIDLLLYYVSRGAELIRLDAIAFMWKEPGTGSIHLPQTHRIIQLMRTVLDIVAPGVVLITETNVPHEENISYFGDGRNEAQMVYNFSLPPLTLHAFHTGSAEVLTQWAGTLTLPSDQVTFFNFLASHDGIGVTPARGLLTETAISAMAQRIEALGGYVSARSQPDGSQIAYELNINYLDALGDPDAPAEDDGLRTRRFLASQAIMLALRGVPGIYFHSLLGSRGWPEGVKQTGRYRTINRQKLRALQLEAQLAQAGSLRQRVFGGYRRMLQVRAAEPAFHPHGAQEVLALHPSVFAVRRATRAGSSKVLCLQNVASATAAVPLSGARWLDLLTNTAVEGGTVVLRPYQVLWLKPER